MLKNIFYHKCCFSKNSIYFFCATLLAASLTACRINPEETLKNEWYVTSYHTPLANTGGTGPTDVIRLYDGGKYSQFGQYCSYTFGTWRFSKSQRLIQLHPVTSKQESLDSYYYITDLKPGRMQVSLYRNATLKPGTEELFFTLEAMAKPSTATDPYKPEMHQWRIKPASPETDEQISKRVKAYLIFLQTVYQHAIYNKFSSIPTGWYPHPLRMHYGNGVRMAYSDELDDWNTCFYDSAQAVKGYQCISGLMYKMKLKKTESKMDRNLDVVEQLLAQMK